MRVWTKAEMEIKKTAPFFKGSLYIFLLLYKTMIYTGSANSSGAADRAAC